jgi:hypothetical protein
VIDLIGRPYELGADGSDGPIDCIHLVYTVLGRLGIATPQFRSDWYQASRMAIARDLLRWGCRIDRPSYDGDVALLPMEAAAFAVTWQNGLLYINRQLQQVAWCPIGAMPTCHCFRMRGS